MAQVDQRLVDATVPTPSAFDWGGRSACRKRSPARGCRTLAHLIHRPVSWEPLNPLGLVRASAEMPGLRRRCRWRFANHGNGKRLVGAGSGQHPHAAWVSIADRVSRPTDSLAEGTTPDQLLPRSARKIDPMVPRRISPNGCPSASDRHGQNWTLRVRDGLSRSESARKWTNLYKALICIYLRRFVIR